MNSLKTVELINVFVLKFCEHVLTTNMLQTSNDRFGRGRELFFHDLIDQTNGISNTLFNIINLT